LGRKHISRYGQIADEDRDRKIQANIVAAEYKKTEAAYLASLRKNQLATQKATADARDKALEIAEAREKLARELTVPGSPIGAAMDADGMPINIDTPYAGVADFDIKTETAALGFKTDAEVEAEKKKLEKLKAGEIETLETMLIEAEEERKKAKPDRKEALNEEIAAQKHPKPQGFLQAVMHGRN